MIEDILTKNLWYLKVDSTWMYIPTVSPYPYCSSSTTNYTTSDSSTSCLGGSYYGCTYCTTPTYHIVDGCDKVIFSGTDSATMSILIKKHNESLIKLVGGLGK